MTNANKQRPVETLRDGAVKAAIWKNEGDNGVFFNVTFARTYKNGDGNLHDTDSFSGTQLLKLARLADKAYDRAAALAQAARAEAENTNDEDGAEA